MYLRKIRRKNKNGSVVEYYQLAQNKRDRSTKKPVAHIIHSFGRADEIDREEMVRLCKSIARICDVEIVDPLETLEQSDNKTGVQSLKKKIAQCNRQIESLKKELAQNKKMLRTLQDSETKYRTIFENVNDEIIYINPEGIILEINDRCEELLGLKREDAIGKSFFDLGYYFSPSEMEKVVKGYKEIISGGNPTKIEEFEAIGKDGTSVFIEVNPRRIEEDGQIKGILNITRDITKRKKLEQELEQYRNHLEELVAERTADLEEANTALRVMLKKSQELKEEMEEQVLFNVKKFILPYLEKLRKSPLSDRQKVYLDHLETNLEDISSPLMHGISVKYLKLTPTEIEIANYIKHGKTTKEIAELLYMSTKTIDAHRYNIRRKLGLNKKNENLRTYLLSLK